MRIGFPKWWHWLFRRGARGSLLLNMAPGDHIVSMVEHRNYLVVVSAYGELYYIDGDRLVEFEQAEVWTDRLNRSAPHV